MLNDRLGKEVCCMRHVIYGCAMGLDDGYIAGPNGEYDWIVMDPDVDFSKMCARFDTFPHRPQNL